MKLFFQLQWQQSRFLFLFLFALCGIAPFLYTYDNISEMQLIIFAYTLAVSTIVSPVRIFTSRDMFEHVRALPLTKEIISKYFIYSQLLLIMTIFILVAPHHFYAAYVQNNWLDFTLSFCVALCVCLIAHAILLPSLMRKMNDASLLESLLIIMPVMLICYGGASAMLYFFPHAVTKIFVIMTALVCVAYIKCVKKYMHIQIYEHTNI